MTNPNLITPYQSLDCLEPTMPSVFLAGPVQGAPDWQSVLADMIYEKNPNLYILSPRFDKATSFDETKQQPWEMTGLERSRDLGGIAFWFAAKSDQAPIPNPVGRNYASTSRQELGKLTGWLNDPRYNFAAIVGFGPGYSGGVNYMKKELAPFHTPIVKSLADLATSMVSLLEKRNSST
jgi:hypothetical protein